MCQLLRAKYLGEKGFYSSNPRGASQFWTGLHEVKHCCARGLIYVVRDGKKARFWRDVWLGACPLSVVYSNIFAICNDQEQTVWGVLRNNEINLSFRRSFGRVEVEEWQQLISQRREVQLQEGPDTVTWGLEKRGNFTTASLYKEITFPGMINRDLMSLWKAKIPMKIKFFLWSIYSDCLPSAEQLVKRNWPGDEKCKMCGQLETSQHIFFECSLANYCWWTYRDALGWAVTPVNLQQFLTFSQGRGEPPNLKMIFLLACICWSLWLIRNDYVFNNRVVSCPNTVVHRSLVFMQKWSILLKAKEKDWVLKMLERLSTHLERNALG